MSRAFVTTRDVIIPAGTRIEQDDADEEGCCGRPLKGKLGVEHVHMGHFSVCLNDAMAAGLVREVPS